MMKKQDEHEALDLWREFMGLPRTVFFIEAEREQRRGRSSNTQTGSAS